MRTALTIEQDQVITGIKTFSAPVKLGVASTTTGEVQFYNAASTFALSLKAGVTASALTFTLPIADAASLGMPLVSNAAGVLSFADLTRLGTVTVGVWSGTAIAAARGGTGLDTSGWSGVPTLNAGVWTQNNVLTANRLLYAAASNTITSNAGLTFDGTTLTASNLTVTTNSSLGTVTAGLWNGTAIGVAFGGTNIASYTIGDLLYASGATTLAKLADVAAGSYLRAGGVGAAPVWSTATLPNVATTAGAYLRADGTNWIMSTLVLPNAITAGSVVFGSAANTYGQDNANFFWDDTNNRLGIGTNAPAVQLHILGAAPVLRLIDSGSRTGEIHGPTGVNTGFRIGTTTNHDFAIMTGAGGVERLTITQTGSVSVVLPGPHAIGGATDAFAQFGLGGNWSPAAAGSVERLRIASGTFTVAANDSAYIAHLYGTFTKAATGTHPDIAVLYLEGAAISGVATATNASTLKIGGAPTGATNNYGLWNIGNSRFDNKIDMGAGSGNTPYFNFVPATASISFRGLSGGHLELVDNAGNPILYATQSRILALGTTVTTGGGAGDEILKLDGALRSVDVAGTGTFILLRGTNSGGASSVDLSPGGQDIRWGKALVALGGGAAPTVGTIGGSGPATAAQNSWLRVLDSTGVAAWVPVWK